MTYRAYIGLQSPIEGFRANAVEFDGINDYLTRGADLTGNADGKEFTFSVWLKTSDTSATIYRNALTPGTTRGLEIQISSSKLEINARPAGSSTEILIVDSTANISTGSWIHIMGSFDLTNSLNRHLYINDSDDGPTYSAYTNDTIDFAKDDHFIGGISSPTYAGDMAEFWFDLNYLDLSSSANRRKFIDSSGNPVELGSDGSTPTGVAPIMFFSGATASWHTNKGTGGGFTENGALTTASTSPSD